MGGGQLPVRRKPKPPARGEEALAKGLLPIEEEEEEEEEEGGGEESEPLRLSLPETTSTRHTCTDPSELADATE